jgi:hypothetical protein
MTKGTRDKGQGTRDKGKAKRFLLAAMLLGLFAIGGFAQAQQPPTPPDGFVPQSSLAPQEQLPAAPLVIGAYAIAWLVVFGYLWSIWRRIGRVEIDLAEVSRRIASGARR